MLALNTWSYGYLTKISVKVKFEEYVKEIGKAHPELSGLARCNNLDNAFRFLTSLRFSIGEMDIVSQDEFTLDIILPFPGEKLYLILGVT
ncbi:MAG: hypothetical protein SGJ27_05415 [Candidatus Melainabacteria bacterium]|nr:hypothetical protein [Candidatus Melainabacteria bacterium]